MNTPKYTTIKVTSDLHRLAKINAKKDGVTLQKWTSDLIWRELQMRAYRLPK